MRKIIFIICIIANSFLNNSEAGSLIFAFRKLELQKMLHQTKDSLEIKKLNLELKEIEEGEQNAANTEAPRFALDDQVPVSGVTTNVDINIPIGAVINDNAYALIIGNEDYNSFQPDLGSEVNVAFAVNDATIFKKYCISTLGVPESNIKFLTNATLGQMIRAISWMNKITEKEAGDADVIVYYAGHGLPDEQTHEPSIMPVDISSNDIQSAIHLKDLYTKLTQYPSKKITVFLDACFSGGGRNQGLVASRGVKVKPKEDALNGNIVVFTSSSGDQSSLSFKEKHHGIFTYYLLKRIQETAGNTTYKDLFDYLKKEVDLNCVKVNEKEQTPNLLFSTELGDHWKGWKLR